MSSTLAITEPPWNMTTPKTPELIIMSVLAVVVAGFVLAALVDWRRSGRPVFLLTLVGGGICSFNEATVDVLGHCHFPGDGIISYTAFNRSVPVWVVLAYVVFFGALPYLMFQAFKRGFSHRAMWIGILVFGVLNVLLELPMLSSKLYVYYGDQPFEVGGFPVIWFCINSLGSLLGAVVLIRLAWFFTGPRQLLVVFVPFATYMASWVMAMPHFLITNTDAPSGVRMAAAIVSAVLCLISIDVLLRIGTGQWRLLPPQPEPGAVRVETPARSYSAGASAGG